MRREAENGLGRGDGGTGGPDRAAGLQRIGAWRTHTSAAGGWRWRWGMDGTGTFSFWQHVLNVVVVARAGLGLGLELELKLGCDAIRCWRRA